MKEPKSSPVAKNNNETDNNKSKKQDETNIEPKNQTEQESEDESSQEQQQALIYSSHLKGYLTIFISSLINYHSVAEVQPGDNCFQYIPKSYPLTVALLSAILTGIIIYAHLDQCTLTKLWNKAFAPKSFIELFLVIFLLLWWFAATVTNTSIKGMAGEGKNSENVYYSTWVCCITSFVLLDHWCVSANVFSLKKFIRDAPHQAAGWFMLSVFSLVNFFCFYLLYSYWNVGTMEYPDYYDLYRGVSQLQWLWLMILCILTGLTSVAFLLVEIFRLDDTKSSLENIFEGSILLLFVVCWIPTVVIATTPGGAASIVGNSYFLTWGCGVLVIRIFVEKIQSWRHQIYEVRSRQFKEYREAQMKAMAIDDTSV